MEVGLMKEFISRITATLLKWKLDWWKNSL